MLSLMKALLPPSLAPASCPSSPSHNDSSPSSTSFLPSSIPPAPVDLPSHLCCNIVLTKKGKLNVEATAARNAYLIARHTNCEARDMLPKQSLPALLDFQSLLSSSSFLNVFDDIGILECSALAEFKALAIFGPDPLSIKFPSPVDLSKPPVNYLDAMRCPDAKIWCAAMQHEMISFKDNGVFQVAPLPPGRQPIGIY
ncbi:hypothetical protein C0992_004003 [Termitomyces sp. T32_za158]|nr:hypothetical protein C0992_004003 [Termitomyces sp. T32_za158]